MSNLIRVTASGEEHGKINVLTNSVEFNDFKHCDGKVKEELKKEKKEDSRLVKVRYINHRGRHERLTKPYCRYAGDPIVTYKFLHGQEYDVPMGLINEVNAVRQIDRAGKEMKDGSILETDRPADAEHQFIPVKW